MVKNLPAIEETWVLSQGWEDPLEEGIATHFSILAWRTPWMGESGRLQATEFQRVEHDWNDLVCIHAYTSLAWTPYNIKKQKPR